MQQNMHRIRYLFESGNKKFDAIRSTLLRYYYALKSTPASKLLQAKPILIEKFLDVLVSSYTSKMSDEFVAIDTHCHTKNSDGTKTVKSVLKQAKRRGLDAILITEHLGYQFGQESFMKSVKQVYRYTSKNGLGSLPSVEISTIEGHVVAIFPEEYFTNKQLIYLKAYRHTKETLELIHKMGGLSIIAHPDIHQSFSDHDNLSIPKRIIEDNLDNIDGIESYNSMSPSVDRNLADRYHKSEFGGSDSHLNIEIGTCFTIAKKKGNLFETLKYGRTKAISPLFALFGKQIPKKIEDSLYDKFN